jgi:predicted HTH transcriptional regulator
MNRKIKIGSISGGLALVALPLGGWLPAVLAAGAGYLIGEKQFPKGATPWRDLHELLNEKEHGRLEFKESLSEETKRKSSFDGIVKSIVGFANTDGGEILLGVSDDAQIIGVSELVNKNANEDKFELALRNALRSSIDGPIDKIFRMKFEIVDDKTILRIEVEKSNQQIFTKQRGEFYIRDGNQTLALTAKEYAHRKRSDDD